MEAIWKKRDPEIPYKESDDVKLKLAKIRGVSAKEYDMFMNPDDSVINSPYLLKNVKIASERIVKAIIEKERICISADPDSDGISSLGISYRYLSPLTDNIYYIYAQRSAGHGIQYQYDKITDDTDLLIILDSSSDKDSVEVCKKIKDRGIDVIILDHHSVEAENPYVTLVNPQQEGCEYPNKHISGACVTYKTLQVVDDTVGTGTIDNYIDLVAVGMYADMMRVDVLENRRLIIEGMKNVNNLGLRMILKANNVKEEAVTSQVLAFQVAPSLNGTARLDKLELALQLVIENNMKTAFQLAKEIKGLNDQRKSEQAEIVARYLSNGINETDKVILITDEQASKGYNGLVATTLTELYQRPAIVMRINQDGECAGSYRGYEGFNMQKFLLDNFKFKNKLIKYAAGHPPAGGVGMSAKNIPKLLKIANKLLKDITFEKKIDYDLEIKAEDLTTKFIKQIEEFNYLTGTGFPLAKFLVRSVTCEDRQVLGKVRQDTVKIGCENNIALMKFRTDDSWGLDIIDENEWINEIDVIGSLNVNSFYNPKLKRNIVTNQVFVDDYRKL